MRLIEFNVLLYYHNMSDWSLDTKLTTAVQNLFSVQAKKTTTKKNTAFLTSTCECIG